MKLNRRSAYIAILVAMTSLNTAKANTPEAYRIWTTVGSGGTVDEADVAKVFFDRGVVQMGHRPVIAVAPGVAPAGPVFTEPRVAVVRYNVTPADSLFQTSFAPRETRLRLRFIDTGADSRVTAKIVEVDMASGAEVIRLTFDSNSFTAASDYQVQQVVRCFARPFDFLLKAYYVEATLTIGGIPNGSLAGIEMIKIVNGGCT
jgi:hypothetical protein